MLAPQQRLEPPQPRSALGRNAAAPRPLQPYGRADGDKQAPRQAQRRRRDKRVRFQVGAAPAPRGSAPASNASSDRARARSQVHIDMNGTGKHWFAVYDGHGPVGEKCSSFACEHVAKEFSKALKDGADARTALSTSHVKTNKMLAANSSIDDQQSGTTAITLYMDGRDLLISNVGDSRAILVRKGGKGVELTSDHRPVGSNTTGRQELDRVTRAGAFRTRGSFGEYLRSKAEGAADTVEARSVAVEDELEEAREEEESAAGASSRPRTSSGPSDDESASNDAEAGVPPSASPPANRSRASSSADAGEKEVAPLSSRERRSAAARGTPRGRRRRGKKRRLF